MPAPRTSLPLLRARLSGESVTVAGVRAALRRVLVLGLAALVLSGALTAGQTYLWCSMMGSSVETCCCEPERSALQVAVDEGSELRNGCCEDRSHDELHQGRLVSAAIDVPPALPATAAPPAPPLPVVVAVTRRTRASPPCAVRASPIRAGPRAASEICARLQVFRC